MKSKIITAFKDNRKDLIRAKKTGQFEDELWCVGYETAMNFVLQLMNLNPSKYKVWEELTLSEQEQAKEIYLSIREHEENRSRDETTQDYPEPMDWREVRYCLFERKENGYIDVII